MKASLLLLNLTLAAGLALGTLGCTATPEQPAAQAGALRLLATTTIAGDVVQRIVGEQGKVDVLLPAGSDPHTFQPTPQDAARLAQADVIFINGAGLETFLQPLLQSSGSQAQIVDLSAGITLLQAPANDEHAGGDPHVWTDPNNVILWVQNAAQVLEQLDAAHAEAYQANAAAYTRALQELDQWISQQVAQVPPEQRKLVMDHEILGYFAARYGFEQVGAVIPGFSTLAEPSAQELAALEDTIQALGAPAVFVSLESNPTLAQRVANDRGIQLVALYSGSLSQPGGPADSYIKLMQFNTLAIVETLKPAP